MWVALADGACRYAANDLPRRDRFNDDGTRRGDAALANTGAVQHRHIGTQPCASADTAAVTRADTLLGDRNIGSVCLIVASAHR